MRGFFVAILSENQVGQPARMALINTKSGEQMILKWLCLTPGAAWTSFQAYGRVV